MGIIKTFTCCISPFFISSSSTPNYTLSSLLVVKLLFLSAVNNVVTILFLYSTSYLITICSMGRVTLVPNFPLNGWERDGGQIVEGLKGHPWCSALMSECGLWVSLFNLMRQDGVHLEDKADIRLVYEWNQYLCVFCGRYSISPVSMLKIRYCSIWCHSNWCLRSMETIPRLGVRWECSSRERVDRKAETVELSEGDKDMSTV